MVAQKPRHNCRNYFVEQRIAKPEQFSKEEFDKLSDKNQFKDKDGPFVETFGDGHGEPYNPWRQAFGILEDGKGVYCELHPEKK